MYITTDMNTLTLINKVVIYSNSLFYFMRTRAHTHVHKHTITHKISISEEVIKVRDYN